MSANMMIVCQEDDSAYHGKSSNLALFIDETSMGEPHHDFGKWFQSRFCGAPRFLEQLLGIKEHNFTLVTRSDVVSVLDALDNMDKHKGIKKESVSDYMRNHIGKHISTENW